MSEEPERPRFAGAVWLAPVAYAAHFGEEYLGFPVWVSAHFPVTFSQAQFQRNGGIFMLTLAGLCFLASRAPGKAVGFVFLTCVSGLFFHNALFHIGATAIFRAYAPGVASGVLLYLPLSLFLAKTALREGVVARRHVLAALVLGGAAHYAVIVQQLT